MKILVVGNMGYIGPVLGPVLRAHYPEATLTGFDTAYFGHCLVGAPVLPESNYDVQYFGDVRRLQPEVLKGVDAVVYLAAISNDPMGNRFENQTMDINSAAALRIASMAKEAGASHFVFAGSCSVYGAAEGNEARSETSDLNPLTAYARSKVQAEQKLQSLADSKFKVTSLRFSTACGMSPRLRLDLVLNDFVANALVTKSIKIMSDGSPWRPLIHVKDMSRAMAWAVGRDGDDFVAVNVGSKQWNYQIRDLANGVAACLPGVTVQLNPDAQPDKRSYKVDFSKFERLAPNHQPLETLESTVEGLVSGLRAAGFNDPDFRNSGLIRLHILSGHIDSKRLSEELYWQGR